MSVYIIGDIGINHNGDIDIARKLISVASFAGCDSVKFQKRNPDICVPEHQKGVKKNTPWGEMTYLEYRKKIEFGKAQYDEINKLCNENKIRWSASVWDLESLSFLVNYDIPFIKIPSALLTNDTLLLASKEEALKKNIKVILSTGMSTLAEVDKAAGTLRGCDFALLHCNSSYPAKVDELNLRCIQTYKERYKCEIGYSGHEFRTGPTVSTVCLGATILERHITLDRTMWGSDHFASLEPEGLVASVRAARDLEKALGDGKKIVTESEKPIRLKLRGV